MIFFETFWLLFDDLYLPLYSELWQQNDIKTTTKKKWKYFLYLCLLSLSVIVFERTTQQNQQQNTLLPNLSFFSILSFVKHQYHAKIDDQIDKALASMTQGLINKLVSVLEATLGKLGRYDEGSLIGSLLSFTVFYLDKHFLLSVFQLTPILERDGFRQGTWSGLRQVHAKQYRSDSQQDQWRPLDFELLWAVVHEANNNFVHVVVWTVGSFITHVSMHLFVANC